MIVGGHREPQHGATPARDSPAAPGAGPAPGTAPAAGPAGPACNMPGWLSWGQNKQQTARSHWGPPGTPIPTHRCWTRIRSTRMCRVRTSAFRSSRASDLPSDPSDTSSPSVLHGRTGACPMLGTGAQSPARGSPRGCSPPQGLPPLPRAMLGGRWPGTRGRVAVGWLSLAVVTDTVLKPLASAKERTAISTWCWAGPGHPAAPCVAPGSYLGHQLCPAPCQLRCWAGSHWAWGQQRCEVAQPGSCQPWPRTWPRHWDIAVAPDSPAQLRLSYLVASMGAGLVLAGTGGAGAILLVSGSLVGSILAGAGSSGERRQEQGWGWDR